MLKFKKTNYITVPRKEQDIPEGMWIKCDACGELLYKEDVVHNHYSCYKCGKYFRLSTKRRLRMVADKQSFEEWDTGLETANPLDYPGYPEKLDGLKEKYEEMLSTMNTTVETISANRKELPKAEDVIISAAPADTAEEEQSEEE